MVTTYVVSATPTRRFVGRCAPCGRPVSGIVDGAAYRDKRAYVTCPDCSRVVSAEQIFGTVSAMDCTAACMGAAGPSCECQCGGENHSARWSQRGEMLASELDAYRAREARKQAEREARRERAARLARREFDAWASEHPALVALLASEDGTGNGFLDDLGFTVRRGEILTGRQTEVAERIAGEVAQRREREAAERENARPVPTGKAITVTGEVVSTRLDDSPYSYGGCVSKMLVKGDGWKVWATIPESINSISATTPGNLGGLRGKTVRFVADVTPSRDDPAFGFAKRPRRAEILTTAAV